MGVLPLVADVAMLPMAVSPRVVLDFPGFFRRIFSWNQFKRFKQYLSGLITGGKVTVTSLASRLTESVDQSSLNRFLALYDWDKGKIEQESATAPTRTPRD